MTTTFKSSLPSPDSYRQRDLAILRHVAAYGVSLLEVIARIFGDGKQLGHIVRRLSEEKLLTLHSRAIEGGVSYCQLAPKGCERIGAPNDRAEPLGAQALDKALAVLVWCCLSGPRRYKVGRSELELVFPRVKFPTNQVFAVADQGERAAVFRVSLVQGGHEPVIKILQRDIASATGELRSALTSRQGGFVLLVDTATKQKSLDAAVERSGLREEAMVRVELSATAKSIAAYLRGQKKANESLGHARRQSNGQ